ncbi:MAG: phospholipase D family protein [Cyclobacteriaceae bacterium]
MKVTFLGQGFTEESPNSIGVHINKYLADKAFNSFYGISAFASPLGIKLLDSLEQAKKSYATINMIVGVDQSGTSKEALEEILKLDVNSFVFYQRESPIFHPKIYLFEGKDDTCLIVGSSNLTGKGLFSNVESSILIQFKNNDQQGLEILKDLKSYFKSLFELDDPNLFKLNEELVSALVGDGVVPSEISRSKQHGKKIVSANLREMRNIGIPHRDSSKIPWDRLKLKSNSTTEEPTDREELELIGNLKDTGKLPRLFIWESGPLSERDLNIPTGANTNATGSMLFKKGKMKDIDQRHYFRDSVFNELKWIKKVYSRSPHIERASTFFQLYILGEDLGVFELTLNHNTDKESKSYKQNQPMTNVSWRSAKKFIKNKKLIGLSAKLYKNQDSENFFTLEIS